MGEIYTAQGDKEKALQQYDALTTRYPDSKSSLSAKPKRDALVAAQGAAN